MNLRYTSSAALAAIVLGACSGEVIEPAGSPVMKALPAANLVSTSSSDLAHGIILKNKNAVGSVSAEVTRLGGTVTYSQASVGLMLVHGLSQGAAASLGSHSGVQEVLNDEVFTVAPAAEVPGGGSSK